MYTDEELDATAAEGVISAEAVFAFRAFVERHRALSYTDEEHFRLLTGFNDIFVSIAIGLILAAVAYLGNSLSHTAGAFFMAAASWALAEFFTRKRRMALPSILLLWAWVTSVFVGFIVAFGVQFDGFQKGQLSVLAACALAVAAAVLHWKRFRVPITIAAGTAAAIATASTAIAAISLDFAQAYGIALLFLCGLATFAFALHWDSYDPKRQTRNSDVAFWLHLLAAPLIVHPAFSALGLLSGGKAVVLPAVMGIGLYLLLGVVALLVDRRALLVSALAYVIGAVSILLKETSGIGSGLAITMLVVGLGLAMLSAFWHPTRIMLLARLPDSWRRRLPHI